MNNPPPHSNWTKSSTHSVAHEDVGHRFNSLDWVGEECGRPQLAIWLLCEGGKILPCFVQKIWPTSPPCLHSTKLRAHCIAHNVVHGFESPDGAGEGCGRPQLAIWLLCEVGKMLPCFLHGFEKRWLTPPLTWIQPNPVHTAPPTMRCAASQQPKMDL